MKLSPTSTLLLGILASLTWPSASQAKLLQIIHTNDLHAHLEHAEDPARGGYAAVKATIDAIRQRAADQGVESLVLDGGDFSEGTMYHYAGKGVATYAIMDAMGYDAMTVGNHDWLVGADQMNRILGSVHLKTPLLGANFAFDADKKNLAETVRPYISVEKAGAKIAILGLTTDQFIYSWRVQDGTIQSAADTADVYAPLLRENHDRVIVLSHLGYKADRKLAKKHGEFDLVIGSHSHTVLKKPTIESGTPIVQTGEQGEYVGDLLVDLVPGKPLKIVHYELVEVHSDGAKDPVIEDMISRARQELINQYGPTWLSEVVGYSEVPLAPPTKSASIWGGLFAESLRDAARAPAAIDMGEFYGTTQPAGPVTREALYNYYPRTFDLNKPFGWTVWKAKIPGWLIKTVIEQSVKMGSYANTAGITYEVKLKKGKLKISKFKIAGKPLHDLKTYPIALSEGLGRGTSEISRFLKLYFKPQDTGIPIWNAVEDRIRRLGPILAPENPN